MPPKIKSSARAKVLAQWRGVDLAPLEGARHAGEQSAAELVKKTLADLKIEVRREDAELVKIWNSLMDPDVIAHAQPANLTKNGTLYVSVDNPAWSYEINRHHRAEILKRLQASFGKEKIKKIFFRAG